ncbi:uncharacterized protein LOC123888689 [Trifolium pratense]|uniref:uncharacterized protein LOC123888689 n=1 Tax=Trifolium pratense TaxID=57577 RepID=UPI001E6902AF|nr:uncharacterized protein LOC123888689 [Trifolium pratense]
MGFWGITRISKNVEPQLTNLLAKDGGSLVQEHANDRRGMASIHLSNNYKKFDENTSRNYRKKGRKDGNAEERVEEFTFNILQHMKENKYSIPRKEKSVEKETEEQDGSSDSSSEERNVQECHQGVAHKKLISQVEEAVEVQLSDAQKKITSTQESVGADVNQKLFRGFATTAAVREGRLDILETLIKAGASQPACEEALLEASCHAQAGCEKLLMSSDLIRPQIAVQALVAACCRGFVDVVETLIKLHPCYCLLPRD